MRELAKVGFSQSYTYFTWRNTRWELTEYLTELSTETVDYLRPNFFVNTPDILHEYLQTGGRPAFEARLVLAATLSPSYGIYSGFENLEHVPIREGSEEYLDSEKYEVKQRQLDGELLPLVKKLNEIRRAARPLQWLDDITFLDTANDHLIAYAKRSDPELVIVVVNLDPFAEQIGLVTVDGSLGLADLFVVTDLLTDVIYDWETGGNYVRLAPGGAHILHVR
jgi:starch synthase (maltosyl-transferring)